MPVLFAAILPLILWPIETVFPFPYIIEELAKAVLVFFVLSDQKPSGKIIIACVAGFFFAFSESVLYLFNIYSVGTLETYFIRLALTTPLHVATTVLMLLLATKKRLLIVPATILAMILHYFFNSGVTNWLLTHPS